MTCNATLEELRVLPGSDIDIVGPLNFHDLALIISAASTLVAASLSLFLIWAHATHYTRPWEQKHIIRILLMVPVQGAVSILSLNFHSHSLYLRLASDCTQAVAISSFFALVCSYVAPTLSEQRDYFRRVRPVGGFGFLCCGGRRDTLKRQENGSLAWFAFLWFGVYQFVLVRPAASVTAVVTQRFNNYCETSNSPDFAHVWVTAATCASAALAMYSLVGIYLHLRAALSDRKLFVKLCAINLIVFLTLWQSALTSIGTSQILSVRPNEVLGYADLKIGIPSLLLCFEMVLFSILNLWAFSWHPYREIAGAKAIFYPVSPPESGTGPRENTPISAAGGFLGLGAIWDAVSPWDVIKSIARGFGWLFVSGTDDEDYGYGSRGLRRKGSSASSEGLEFGDLRRKYPGSNSTEHLPIANEFRRSKYMMANGTAATDVLASRNKPATDAIFDATTIAAGPNGATNETHHGHYVPSEPYSLPQSPAPTSPGFPQRLSAQEQANLISHAASPGRLRDLTPSPYRDPPSPYRDEFSHDDLANHPGVAVPYPGYLPDSPRPRNQQQLPPPQWRQQAAGPNQPQRPRHQHNFSRNLAGPPQYGQTPPQQQPGGLQPYDPRRERRPSSDVLTGGMI